MNWIHNMIPAALRAGRTGPVITDQLRLARPDAEAWMVFGMRLLLAVSALLTLYIAPSYLMTAGRWAWLTFAAYVLNSLVLLCVARVRAGFWHGPVVYWVDIGWYGLMICVSGGVVSPFFTLFFFAILAASFRHGFDAGARVTLGAGGIVTIAVLLARQDQPLYLLLLRATFMLALGYMIAFWGGLLLDQRRRLALLRDVSHLSNPRFGVQHTLDSLMQKILRFYGANDCVLLMQNSDGRWMLNTVHHPQSGRAISHNWAGEADVQPLLELGKERLVLYRGRRRTCLAHGASALAWEAGRPAWFEIATAGCERIADLLDAQAFICAPLRLRKGTGRIFLTADKNNLFGRGDANFLGHIVSQAFPVIETIDLLDRLASDAAFRERQTIARDLHDSTIQPYIGLRHAVAAIRNRAGGDSPVRADLDRLLEMSDEVVADMRQFARRFRDGRPQEPELLIALRRQLAQIRAFYGVEIALETEAAPLINDRLAAEVFQIVNEGVSNICKHTKARFATVRLAQEGQHLTIDIRNPVERASDDFVPASIAGRVRSLGGALAVEPGPRETALRIRIPY